MKENNKKVPVKDALKINKKIVKILVIVIAAIIIIALVAYFGYGYYLGTKKSQEIITYKQDVYNSILCEFNCPLTEQEFNGKKQLLPEVECVKTCSEEFRGKNYSLSTADREFLIKDGFLTQLSTIVTSCQNQSVDVVTKNLNISKFSSCARTNLEPLKEKYPYLDN
ncbi:MAG TPA: hypothetical protein VI815_04385 [Candidatus Nanoarchaeia archaeon]|nr:hypothetical protein [Candidatus Nanoarchaeia archaeon]